MLPAHLAARLLKQRRAEESAEFARQLPLYVDDMPPFEAPAGEDNAARREPDWATDY